MKTNNKSGLSHRMFDSKHRCIRVSTTATNYIRNFSREVDKYNCI